ncbi:TonB-dependent receptor [Steroidobacter flavus]|uniref:TonB-dependent receptor n=1 Tax=Steroidobacter flavus TaxID=1842136 RepID=A0ABV8T5M3_9GAMM
MRISLALLAAVPGLVNLASAAEAEGGFQLEEVVVTATKHAEPLLNVPIAVTAITAQDILSKGITQYADILSSVPGVYYEDAGPGDTTIRIRGISPGGGGTPPTVATYFGEIPMSAQGGGNLGQHATPRFVDIDRVEVLRGPQGTVFGANALAGAVRVIPAAPDLKDYQFNVGTRGFATAHSDDMSYHVEGMVNLPLVEDQFALRLVGYKDDIAGYIDNKTPAQAPSDYSFYVGALTGGAVNVPPGTLMTPATGALNKKDINSTDTTGGRLSAAWQVNDRLRLDLMVATQDAEMDGESSVTPGSYEIVRSSDYFANGYTSEDLDLGGLTIRYDWDNVSLISATSQTKLTMARLNDAAELLPPAAWLFQEKREAEAFTQEIRLQSRGEGAFRWTVGAFYLDQETDGRQHIRDLGCEQTPTCLPLLFTNGAQNYPLDLTFHLFEKQKAVFVDTSYEFAPRWTLGLGARYLEEDIGVKLGSTGILAPPPGASNGGEDSASKFNPAASVTFKPTDDLTLYVQAAEGFRSGVANQALPQSCRDQAAQMGLTLQAVTEPDTIRNYELGFKSRLGDGRVNLNVAAYRLEWKDIPGSVLFDCAFSNLVNAGDATGEGVEFELVGRLSESWKVNLAASYNDLTYDDNVLPAIGAPGDRVVGSPAKNYSAGLEYGFDLSERWAGWARADWAYVGSLRSELSSLPIESYDTVNVRFGLVQESVSIELFGRNITDEQGITRIEPLPFGGDYVLIRPREVGIEVRYRYK